ncbi:MAG: MFS transporter [Firmicutes bacterium]|nr:MFS transporter [Bacillota bacterium]MCL5040110.1 MFS transporter [Bacillota bacterium]
MGFFSGLLAVAKKKGEGSHQDFGVLAKIHVFSALPLLIVSAFLMQFGFGLQRTIYNNFVGQELRLSPQLMGLNESIREIPGLLTVVMSLITARFAEPGLAGATILVMALGLFLHSLVTGFPSLVLATLVMSVGFHLYSPLQSSLVLSLAPVGQKGKMLGQVNSLIALGALTAMGFVYFISAYLNYRAMFVIAAAVAAVGGLFMFLLPSSGRTGQRKPFVFKARYRLYYLLTLLSGARRHMFITFAPFALVTIYGTPVKTIATLLVVSNILALFTRPWMGRLIDLLGERKVLVFNYACLASVFLGYAFLTQTFVLYALYILDNLFLASDVGATTYLDRIAPHDDISPTLAMGGTINHISGVTFPALGGFLWTFYGPAATFLAGALLAVLSLLVSSRLPGHGKAVYEH